MGTTSERAASGLAIAALTAVALALRVSQIDQGLFGDELFTFDDVHGRSLGGVVHAVHTGAENSPPLYFVLAWASTHLGDDTVWIRLPSVLLGSATVPLIYALGREAVGRVAGLIGAAIVALSPFALFYSVEARPYATMVFFVALSTLALLKAVSTRSRWWWALYALAAAGAAYTHYTSIFLLVVQGCWSLWRCRDRPAAPLLSAAGAAALYLPWLPYLRGTQIEIIGRLVPLSVSTALDSLAKTLAGYPFAPLREVPSIAALLAVGAGALLGLAALAHRAWPRPGNAGAPALPRELGLLAALAAATPAGLLIYSLLSTDLFGSRELLASLPAAALVLGALLALLPRRLTALTAIVVSAALLTGTVRSLSATHRRDPANEVARYIEARAEPGAVVVYVPFFALIGADPLLWRDLVLYLPRRLAPVTRPNPWGALRRAPQAFAVGPRVDGRVIVQRPPRSQRRRLLATAEFAGLHPQVVFVYGPPSGAGGRPAR